MHGLGKSAQHGHVERRSKEKKGMQRALSAPTRKKQKEAEEAAGEWEESEGEGEGEEAETRPKHAKAGYGSKGQPRLLKKKEEGK